MIAAAHNGGRIKVNLGSPQNGGDFSFLNLMKGGQEWSLISAVSPFYVEPSILDTNGYPTSIPASSNGIATTFFGPTQAQRPGNYVLKWTGNGTVYMPSGTAIAYTVTAASIAAQCILTCSVGTGNNTFNLRVGQPITVSGFSGTGWASINDTWSIVAVDTTNHLVTIGFNSGGLAAPTLTSATITNTKSTTVNGGLAGAGRYVFSTTAGGWVNTFSAGVVSVNSSVDYPTNLIFCHEDDEALSDAGQVFGQKFLAKFQEANFGAVRHLGWQFGNVLQITNWASRKPQNYVFYQGTEYRASIYGGITTNVGNAYSCSFPSIHLSDGTAWSSGGPKDKDTIIVGFNTNATQSGLCSLNVGASGAINILNQYSNPLTVGGNSYPLGGAASAIACLVYDATLNAWIKQGGDLGELNRGISNGAPFEIMLQLCATVGAHPHFVGAQFALDPPTDFHTQLATYCKNNAPGWMIRQFEGTNETWNTSGGFTQTIYAQNKRAVFNGSQVPSGVLTTTSYNVSAFTYPSAGSGAGFADITLSTTGNSFLVGSFVIPSGLGGISNLPSSFYVTAINVGGNANKITVQFTPTGSYTSGGTITPNTSDYMNWYGQTMSYLGQMCASVYGLGNLGSTYWVIAGVQTGQGGSASGSNSRLQSTSFVLNNSPAGGFVATAAGNWVSHICCAQYLGPNSGAETTPAATFAGCRFIGTIASGVVTVISGPSVGSLAIGQNFFGTDIPLSSGVTIVSGSGASWTLSDLTITRTVNTYYAGTNSGNTAQTYVDLMGAAGTFTVSGLNTLYGQWYTWAQGFTNSNGAKIRMTGYEGGYSVDYTASGSNAHDVFLYATKFITSTSGQSLGLESYYTQNLNNFITQGGEFPAELVMTGKMPSVTVWAILEDLYQSPNPPQWEAARLFGARKRRLKVTT